MNNFFVFVKFCDKVYEPAEGGYNVSTKHVIYCEEFRNINDALDDYNEVIDELKKDNYNVTSPKHPEVKILTDYDGNTFLYTPFGYAVNGYEKLYIGITSNKPEDELYEGYR